MMSSSRFTAGRARDRRRRQVQRDPRFATLCRLSDAGHPADIPGQGLCAGLAGTEYRAARHAAGAQFGRTQRTTCLLRQCELHPGLPDRREIRRDRASVSGREDTARSLHAETTATRVEVGAEGHVTAIHFKRWDGSEGVARGKIFVLAAHAIETPRLLLHSRGEAMPNGVANSSDQVGRNLMDHPTQLSWALAQEPVWPYRGPLSTSGIENFRDHAFRKDRPAMRIEIGNDGWAWPKGAPVTTAADFACRGCVGAASTAHCATRPPATSASPRRWNSCPTREPRDARSRRKGHIRRAAAAPRLSPRRLCRGRPCRRPRRACGDLRQARRHGDPASRRAGRRRPHHGHGAHGQRSEKLGGRPRSSSHDHRNLFILGSAVFPTGATANPTLTIAALEPACRREGEGRIDAKAPSMSSRERVRTTPSVR